MGGYGGEETCERGMAIEGKKRRRSEKEEEDKEDGGGEGGETKNIKHPELWFC